MNDTSGIAHFIAQSDAIGITVLTLLISMSVATWYLVVAKSLANRRAARNKQAFLARFWAADSVAAAHKVAEELKGDDAFARMASAACHSADQHSKGVRRLSMAGGLGEHLIHVLRNELDQEALQVEYGLTVLASASSAAPYVGLFGTVWGIYHALLAIGLSGQGTLDKVAGPVGEALIMTAAGLAVAIPAVLAYNAFTRHNRLWLGALDKFAHDILLLLTAERETPPLSSGVAVKQKISHEKQPAGAHA